MAVIRIGLPKSPLRFLSPSGWRLRTKLLASFLAALLPVLALLLLTYRAEFAQETERLLDGQMQTAEAVAALVDTVFDEALGIGRALADDPALRSPDPLALDARLRRAARRYPQYQLLAVMNMEADTFGTSGSLPGEVKRSGAGADLPWLRPVLAGSRAVVSPVFRGRGSIEGIPVIVAAVPLRSAEGAPIGAVNVALRADTLAQRLFGIALWPEQHIFLADPTGRAAFHTALPDIPWEERDLSGFGPLAEAREGRPARLKRFVSPLLGDSRLGVFVATPKHGWVVGVSMREDAALAALRGRLRMQLLFWAAIALFSLVLILVLSERLVGPIRRLAAHARALGQGDLGQRFRLQRGDELGELGRTFNGMAEGLQRREAELQEGGRRLEIATEAARLGLHDYDAVSGVLQWDARVRELWGLEADEPVTTEVFVAGIHPDDRASVRNALERAFDPRGNAEYHAEFRVVHRRDGRTRWVAATGKAFFADGKAVRLVGTAQDISERRWAEEALRESQRDLSRAQAVARIGSWRFHARDTALSWSEEAYRIFAIPVGTPMSYERFLDAVHPEDRPFVERSWAAALRGEPYDIEHRIVAGGVVKWVRERAELEHDAGGEVQGGFGTVQDISERKWAEERINSLARFPAENPNPVLRVERDGRVVYANQASQPLMDSWGIRTGQPLPADLQRAVRDALDRDTPRDAEVACGSRVFLFNFAPTGKREGVNLYGRDITAIRQAEQALLTVNETLERQVAERTAVAEQRARQLQALALQLSGAEERERRRIADLLHDDLQQLLSACRFHLSVLQPVVQEDEAARSTVEQVDALLEESIGKSRRLSQDLSPAILFHSGLPAAAEMLARLMQERHGLEVTLDCGGWKPLKDDAASIFLYRILQELLFNVVKHSGVSQARVRLLGLEDRAEIVVEDLGRGFEPRSLEQIGAQGRGFGLFGIRERIQYLGGSLAIESVPGKGSRFTLSIPLKGLHRSETARPEPLLRPAQAPPLRLGGKTEARWRVLLVDDHPVMRQGLITVLEGQPDIQVIGVAADGEEAVELARELQPDVIVMDVSMPRMDGIEATRRIKAELPGVRVIGLSMFGDKDTVERMKAAGAEAHLSKEKAAEELVETIHGPGPWK